MENRVRSFCILLSAFAVFMCIVDISSMRGKSNDNSSEEIMKQEEEVYQSQTETDFQEEVFLEDYNWYKKIYNDAVSVAEEHGIYQFLELKKTWTSQDGYYCAFFAAEYSDSGVYLEAQSMEVYELTFIGSIYTKGFAGMDYRILEVDEKKVTEVEEILLLNEINERCRLCRLDDEGALINTSAGIWYDIDIKEKTMTQMDIQEGKRENGLNWNLDGAWQSAYQYVIDNWIKVAEFEREFADTLGGTVKYDPYLLNHIGKDLFFERYALNDLDNDGIPELILLSDHNNSMNAVFSFKDRLIYCGTYYNALFTDDGKIIERGSWLGGSAMIVDEWTITEIKEGVVIENSSIWGEYQDFERANIRYMYQTEETTEISYEEYCEIKNKLLFKADFLRNICSEPIM